MVKENIEITIGKIDLMSIIFYQVFSFSPTNAENLSEEITFLIDIFCQFKTLSKIYFHDKNCYNKKLMRNINMGKSLLIILGIGFMVNILQLVHSNFLHGIPQLWIISALIFAFILITLIWFQKVLSYLKSVKFAVALLIIITLSIIMGTFVVQDQPAAFYKENFGSFSSILFLFSMDSLYRSWWFNSYLFLLSASLVFCTLTRKKLNWKELGFYITHLGIVVLLFGALIGDISGLKGFLDLKIGERKGEINLIERGVKTTKTKPLGFDVELANFTVEEYFPEHRLFLWKFSEKTKKYSAILSIKPTDKRKLRLPENISFFIKDYYPDFYIVERVVKKNEDELNPILRLSLKNNGRKEELFLHKGRSSYYSPEGEIAIHFNWERKEEIEKEISLEPSKGTNIVEISINGKTYKVKVEKGDIIEKDGYTIKFVDFFPHFIYDTEKKEAFSLSPEPKNPALRVEVTGKEGETQRLWLFGKVSGFEKVKLFEGALELKYIFENGAKGAENHIFVYGTENSLKIINKKSVKDEKFELPYTFSMGKNIITIEEIIKNGEIVSEYSTRSQNSINPAILLHIETQNPSDHLLLASNPEPIYLVNGRLALTFERKVEEIKEYRSELRFILGGKVEKVAQIEVNKPFKFKGYLFYQSNYDPKDLTYSGIEVVKDPGLPFVWLGFAMLALGIFHSFFIKGRLVKTKTEE